MIREIYYDVADDPSSTINKRWCHWDYKKKIIKIYAGPEQTRRKKGRGKWASGYNLSFIIPFHFYKIFQLNERELYVLFISYLLQIH